MQRCCTLIQSHSKNYDGGQKYIELNDSLFGHVLISQTFSKAYWIFHHSQKHTGYYINDHVDMNST